MARRPTLILGLGAVLARAWAVSAPAAQHATPAHEAGRLRDPQRRARRYARRSRCGPAGDHEVPREGGALFAIFVVENIPARSTLSAVLGRERQAVFLGTSKTLTSAITTPRTVYMGFRKTGLKNGVYNFQFILNGRPHVLGSVTRKC